VTSVASSFVVVGPGKVGRALARSWREAGYRLIGFVGRDPAAAASAVQFAGGGAVLPSLSAAASATFVLLSVPDDQIAGVAARAVEAAVVRPCSLWMHASGGTATEVLAPIAAAGARIGSLHPLCPFPTAEAGHALMAGRVAVVDGPPRSQRLLKVLARAAGLEPRVLGPTDRVLYHAACALAANGATVLHALATRYLAAAAPAVSGEAGALTASLMQAAVAAGVALGPEVALTGPAVRGDVAVLRRHLDALSGAGLPGRAVFVGLMREAAAIALARGDFGPDTHRRVLAVLEDEDRG
jgi:predicted short-subunit dehydrogenase-like oxidoreductase (DUF2520 family)